MKLTLVKWSFTERKPTADYFAYSCHDKTKFEVISWVQYEIAHIFLIFNVMK